MNFIVKLSVSEKPIIKFKADFIMVVVDRLIKDIMFIFFTEKADAEELAYVFLK